MVGLSKSDEPRAFRPQTEILRWLLVATLVYAPWAYACVRPAALQGLDILLVTTCGLCLIDCAACRRCPSVPLLAWIVVAALLIQGWSMALNAHSSFDADLGTLVPISSSAPYFSGSANGAASIHTMYGLSGLLGIFLFSCDLAAHSVWRKRVLVAVALTGASIAAFGIAQKIGGDSVLALVWEPARRDATNNFAMFRYRGNAGAYLNLVLPLAAVMTFLAFQRRDRPGRKAVWSAALFLIVLGIQLNPSRGSWLISILLTLAVIALLLVFYRHQAKRWWIIAPVLLLMLSIGLLAALGGWQTGWERLSILGMNPADRSPVEIYASMVPDAGALGFGPGTFAAIFPAYQQTYDFQGRAFPPFWQSGYFAHAHNDYFETVIEWGWLGTMLIAILVAGGFLRGLRRCCDPLTRFSQRCLEGASLLALGGILLQALVDFPLQIAALQLDFAVLLGLSWGSESRVSALRSSRRKRPA